MRVASLRLRLLAALVDAAVVIGGMAALVGLGIVGAVAYARVRRDKDEQEGREEDEQDGDEQDEREGGEEDEQDGDEQDEPFDIHCTTRKLRQSPELRAALWGASAGLAVASRIGAARAFGWSVFVASTRKPVGSSAFAALSSECCSTRRGKRQRARSLDHAHSANETA
jgi:hypothetical protein